jgi:hypothetical protein
VQTIHSNTFRNNNSIFRECIPGFKPSTYYNLAYIYEFKKTLPVHVDVNPLKAELNPICNLLALLGAHHILHVSRIKVNTI